MFLRETSTGDLEGLESFAIAVIPAVVSAGAAVGSAALNADAVKYAASQQKKATVIASLSDLKARLAETDAAVELEKTKAQKGVTFAEVGAVLLGLWLLGG